MSDRRKFIKNLSIGSVGLVIGMKKQDREFSVSGDKGKGPFLATGIKIGEVSDRQAIVWARLTRNPERVDDSKAEPTVLYKNDQTGVFELKKKNHPNREPKVLLPPGTTVDNLAGAVPAAEGEVRVQWRIAGDDTWRTSLWKPVSTRRDATVQFTIDGLRPAKKYELKVEARPAQGVAASAAMNGKFKTAPEKSEKAKVKFMVTTCQEYHDRDLGSEGFKIYKHMLRQQPDFLVQTGDNVYYDQQAKSVALARWHWQRMYSFPTLKEFYSQVGSYFMKDDHDTWMNDCYPTMKTRFMGGFTFQDGQQLFLDQVPMGDKTYRTYRWGRDLQIWMVEGRDYRSPDTMADGPDKTIWGKEQIRWFKETVRASDATFRILISPTPIVGPDRPQKIDNHSNQSFYHEGALLRKFIQQQPNMHVITGDRHWQYASRDRETGVLEFSCGPASNEHAGGWKPGDVRMEELYMQVIGGYLEVQVERRGNQPVIIFRHHDVDGNVVFHYAQYATGQF